MRRLLRLEVDGHLLWGTLHEAEGPPAEGQVGVLLVSFGQQPRAWVGDLGSLTGDELAAAGFPVFRFDMPGTGDSPGELPPFVELFWRHIQDGGHEAIAKALIRELQQRYRLRGLVVGGFCGGAITALHASGVEGAEVLGLALLEPEVGLTPVSKEGEGTTDRIENVTGYLERVDAARRKLLSPRAWMRLLSGRSDGAHWWGLIRYAAARTLQRWRGRALPPDANHKMLEAWAAFRARRRPVLVVTVGSETRRKYYASYGLSPGKSEPSSGLSWVEVQNTTHAMLSGGAREAVPRLLAEWLRASFPAPGAGPVAAGEVRDLAVARS